MKKIKIKKAFTFIESLVVLFIFSVVLVSFYSTFSIGSRHIIESKNRLAAISLANQKMEIIRNLSYENVGITGGIPNGPIDPDEHETVNGRNFHILTDIRYRDDDFDGTQGGSPSDIIPADYKVVRITVKWGEETANQEVFLTSFFVPSGVETTAGGGTLSLNVMNSEGQGVSSVNVHIVNSAAGVDFNSTTDASGNLLIPGAPSTGEYQITLSKSNYENVTTYPAFPSGPYNPPIDENFSIAEGSLMVKSFIMNLLSDIKITTADPFDQPIGNLDFSLEGGRILGTDPISGDPVSNYDQSSTSDANGEKNIENISPGNYTFTTNPSTDLNYALFKVVPNDGLEINKFVLSAGASLGVKAIFLPRNIPSCWVRVKNSSDSSPITGANVRLFKADLSYDATSTTDEFGQVYFPVTTTQPLLNEQYQLEVSASGFNNHSEIININNLTEMNVSLNSV